MTLLFVWNLVQRYWLVLVIASVLVFAATWHYAAIRSAVKANNVMWEAKNKVNEAAWVAKIKEANDATKTKEVTFATAVDAINSNHEKDAKNANEKYKVALSRVATGNLILRDKFDTSQCATTSEVKTQTPTGMGDSAKGRKLSVDLTNFLIGQATLADQVVRESNSVKLLLIETYKACSN